MSPSPFSILFTGATGNVGRVVATDLLALLPLLGITAPKSLVLGVRDPSRAQRQFPTSDLLSLRRLDLTDPATFPESLQGISSVFLCRPPDLSDPKPLIQFCHTARDAGVKHIAFLSLLDIEDHPHAPHFKIEQDLKTISDTDAGFAFTSVRAGFFMQNLITTHKKEIVDLGEIVVPAGNGPTSFVDVRDIGLVSACACLANCGIESLPGAAAAQVFGGVQQDQPIDIAFLKGTHMIDVTGPESLTYHQVASILSDASKREIKYKEPSAVKAVWSWVWRGGVPMGKALVMSMIYSHVRRGNAGRVSSEVVERLARRKAISLTEFAAKAAGELSAEPANSASDS
ncbi:hypothetical protein BCR44DRAFT_38452 [Catenaria anguillulae PL171]|uniref:NmrA-like domain-containing protein n=1 Tax=Catenaria anguillulae PL171 TaxID=765915 RepID=A0A1Y2HP80_9FUNG|nr:hypothetical protein BCR44DRAFT_38452 [Catenaria anguillulae PL171]